MLEATPRIYQVTPDIPDRRRATKQEQVRPQIWPTASKRVSSPPVGTFSTASDVTDSQIQTASLEAQAGDAYAFTMDEFPDSKCDCCREGHARAPRSGTAVVCLVCQEPCNVQSCVERNQIDAEDLSELLVSGTAADLWRPKPRPRSELPRVDE